MTRAQAAQKLARTIKRAEAGPTPDQYRRSLAARPHVGVNPAYRRLAPRRNDRNDSTATARSIAPRTARTTTARSTRTTRTRSTARKVAA